MAADQIVAKPSAMPWDVAGGFTAGAQTAELAWEEVSPQPGDVVLIHGAAGNVGGFAVQLAGMRGARVIGTSRPEHHDYLRGLGAEPVDYRNDLVGQVRALSPDGVDVVLDALGQLVTPLAGEPRPIALVRHLLVRELIESFPDSGKGHTNALGCADEGDQPQRVPPSPRLS